MKELHNKMAVVKYLKNLSVTNVKYSLNRICLTYDKKRLCNRIIIRDHLGYVGSWSKIKKEIYIDNDLIKPNEMVLIAIHETVEKYVSQKYHLPEDTFAHEIATVVEHRYARKKGINIQKYERRVAYVHQREI